MLSGAVIVWLRSNTEKSGATAKREIKFRQFWKRMQFHRIVVSICSFIIITSYSSSASSQSSISHMDGGQMLSCLSRSVYIFSVLKVISISVPKKGNLCCVVWRTDGAGAFRSDHSSGGLPLFVSVPVPTQSSNTRLKNNEIL